MTTQALTSYGAFLCLTILMTGTVTAHASEVTGSLSSDDTNNSLNTGDISGSVSSENSGSSGGGGRSGRSGDSLSNPPLSPVFAAIDITVPTPRFPNAGTAPEEAQINDRTMWSKVTSFLQYLFLR